MTVTGIALSRMPLLDCWTERRHFAYLDSLSRCQHAVGTVLGFTPSPLRGSPAFSFDGQSGYFGHLLFRVEGLTFEFEWSHVTLRYHEDRLRLVEVHGTPGFNHVIFGISELGHVLNEMPPKHPAWEHINVLLALPPTEVRHDPGVWSVKKGWWER